MTAIDGRTTSGEMYRSLTVTDSNGLPATRLMYLSSNPPNPTFSSASTSNGSSVGVHSFHIVRSRKLFEEDDEVGGARTVEAVQKGMKEA